MSNWPLITGFPCKLSPMGTNFNDLCPHWGHYLLFFANGNHRLYILSIKSTFLNSLRDALSKLESVLFYCP